MDVGEEVDYNDVPVATVPHHQDDSCISRRRRWEAFSRFINCDAGQSHETVSTNHNFFVMWDKVTRQCPQTTTFLWCGTKSQDSVHKPQPFCDAGQSHETVSTNHNFFVMRDKVTRQCPQTTTFLWCGTKSQDSGHKPQPFCDAGQSHKTVATMKPQPFCDAGQSHKTVATMKPQPFCDAGQSHKTVATNHNLFVMPGQSQDSGHKPQPFWRESREPPRRYVTEPPLTHPTYETNNNRHP